MMEAGITSRAWIKKAILNLVEHGVTRGADALTSLVLIAALDPTHFGQLAVAQALIAPLLLLFLAPENLLYRDFAGWKAEGDAALAARIAGFRRIAWSKAVLGVVLSAGAANYLQGPASLGDSFASRFSVLLWAFGLVLIPQVAGPDRECMRLDLRLRELNLLTIVQKGVLLGGVAFLAGAFPGSLGFLAAWVWVVLILNAGFARSWNLKLLGASGKSSVSSFPLLRLLPGLREFTLAQHLAGVIQGWVQNLDLFFLGFFAVSSREIGLYGAVLKLGNFALAVPFALGNVFGIWISRRYPTEEGRGSEQAQLWRMSAVFFVLSLLQGAVLWLFAPWLFELLSRSRWTSSEMQQMQGWFGWILAGASLIAATFAATSWLTTRTSAWKVAGAVFLPWFALAAVLYAGAAVRSGAAGVALMNVPVALALGGLVLLRFWSLGRRGGK